MKRVNPMIQKLLRQPYLERLLLRDTETLKMVETLHRRENKREIFFEIWRQRIVMLAAGGMVAVLFLAAGLCQSLPQDVIVNGNYLRKNPGQEQAVFDVEAETEAGTAGGEVAVDLSGGEQTEEEAVGAAPDPREVLFSEIREAIQTAVSAQAELEDGEKVALPETVSGKEITYRNQEQKRDFTSFYLSLLMIGIMPFLWKRQRQEQMKKRDGQLNLDYPELVNKFMLLLSAGLTVRGSVERICGEYQMRLGEGGERRYVYEEILYTFQEMSHGISETRAIENFGKRCRQLSYLRFSSLITQNIRKGSEGLTNLLEAEALEAFEKRKEQVKVMGETAGTKLLLPMILMLGVVMVIIVVPAFMTM